MRTGGPQPSGQLRWVTLCNRYSALVVALWAFSGVLNRTGQLLELIQRGTASFGLGHLLQSALIQQNSDPSLRATVALLQNAVEMVLVPYGIWIACSLIAYGYWFATLVRLAVDRLQGEAPRISRWCSPWLAFGFVLVVALAKLWIDRAMVLAVASDPLALDALTQFTSIQVRQFHGPDALGAGGLVAVGVLVLGVYVWLGRWIGSWAARRGLL